MKKSKRNQHNANTTRDVEMMVETKKNGNTISMKQRFLSPKMNTSRSFAMIVAFSFSCRNT